MRFIRTTAPLRVVRAAVLTTILTAGLLAGGGVSHAASAVSEISDPGQFKLTKKYDFADQVEKLKANSRLTPVKDPLSALAGTGHTGKNGLCYPTPFHPGIGAEGYCWNNQDDSTGGPESWTPQGFAVKVDDPRWQAVTWHASEAEGAERFARITFVDRSSATPRFNHALLVLPDKVSTFRADGMHADSVVWKGDRITIGTGRRLLTYDINDLMKVQALDGTVGIWEDQTSSAHYHNYILPPRTEHTTTPLSGDRCTAVTGTSACLTSLSYDSTGGGSLVSSEYVKDGPGGRIIRWPYSLGDTVGESKQATAAWTSPIHSQQGAVFAEGNLFVSGSCPESFDNSADHGTGIDSCIHKAVPGESPHVLTAAPDMTQNLAYDPVGKRVWGINERYKADEPRRVVFSIKTTPTPITTVRFKNIGSDKCLMQYGGSLNSGANAVQWSCNGKSPQNWYWDGQKIRNFSSNLCLTVSGASKSNGAQITQWTCNGSTAQNWTLRKNQAGGGAHIVNANSNLCLTSNSGSADNGANIVQWACNPQEIKHSWNGG
ncbi:hypothetical protein DMA15_30890 [Streptomyces sp. WAC 01529]|uniref:RICIN domain-containing protein n=1 Tax=Streptomyces sp. WAC 01529 TaxID=2203205 RepID=UPI000F71CF80|nr:RICIN domain-containing protein [Streptomyces sp. WAC 01529]AZM56442.1 hypothetical protein DMA15_30890 [Streptomyces sp. WAC 01529]